MVHIRGHTQIDRHDLAQHRFVRVFQVAILANKAMEIRGSLADKRTQRWQIIWIIHIVPRLRRVVYWVRKTGGQKHKERRVILFALTNYIDGPIVE